MPLTFGADIVEGKVYRKSKKRQGEEDEEKEALKELEAVLNKKNRKPCDCEAQIHELVENCFNCGRLTCSAEGPGKCLFCGGIILTNTQRSKLSKYIDIVHAGKSSNTFRQATKIIDSQTIDHFSIDSKKHLKESEKKLLKKTLDELKSKRYQRKLVLDVDIDNLEAGTHSAPVVDDYEAELRLLQLNENPGPMESSFSLAELVHKESKKNYLFEYIPQNLEKQRKPINSQEHNFAENHSENKISRSSGQNVGSSANYKPNKSFELKTNHKNNKPFRKRDFSKKSEPKSNAWNKAGKSSK